MLIGIQTEACVDFEQILHSVTTIDHTNVIKLVLGYDHSYKQSSQCSLLF